MTELEGHILSNSGVRWPQMSFQPQGFYFLPCLFLSPTFSPEIFYNKHVSLL